MAEIQPFRGVLYNTQRVKPSEVLTQPYDKITPEMRERYLRVSPYNLVRIELGKEEPGDTETSNKYTRAGDLYRAWLQEGVLRRSAQPSLYYLEQMFAPPDGSPGTRTRRALIARVRLSRWDEGHVLPHEHTLSKPKADRMSLLRAVGAQQGQIFMLYPKPSRPLPKLAGALVLEAMDDYNIKNRLWEVSDPGAIQAVQDSLRDLKFYIADGHHRYETALAFRDECQAAAEKPDPDAPYEFVMATLVDMGDPGLIVLPTHRTVSNLKGFDRRRFREQLPNNFVVESVPSLDKLLTKLRSTPHHIGMFDGDGFTLLRPKKVETLRPLFEVKPPLWHTLDVAVLHVALLEALLGIDEERLREEANVAYWREPEKAVAQVIGRKAMLAFFLNPTPVADVKAIADARSRMPQKSTDFFPKLLSGMVQHEVYPDKVGAR